MASITGVVPSRKDFINQTLYDEEITALNDHNPVHFMPNDVMDYDVIENAKTTSKNNLSSYNYYLLMVGILPSGAKAVVFTQHKPYFFIRIPDSYLGLDVLSAQEPPEVEARARAFTEIIKGIKFESTSRGQLNQTSISYYTSQDSFTLHRKHGFTQYENLRGYYIKLVFNSLKARNYVLKKISYEVMLKNSSLPFKIDINGAQYDCHTAVDDESNYMRVFFRESRLNSCAWNKINKYDKLTPDMAKERFNYDAINVDTIIVCTDKNICSDTPIGPQYTRDNTVVCTWDIECNRHKPDGELPCETEPLDTTFMISCNFGHYYNTEPSHKVCISTLPVDIPNVCCITCTTQTELIIQFAEVIARVQPDFIVGFNDGDFDWPFVLEKAKDARILELIKEKMSILYKSTFNQICEGLWSQTERDRFIDMSPAVQEARIAEYIIGNAHIGRSSYYNSGTQDKKQGHDFVHEIVKLDAETNTDVYMFHIFGCIPIDLRCLMRAQMMNPAKSSLNFFLQSNGIAEKKDMPIAEMNQIYNNACTLINTRATIPVNVMHDIARIGEYCVYDASSCHTLLAKRNLIMDCRLVSGMARTTMYDAIYRANSTKVVNFILGDAHYYRDIICSNVSVHRGSGAPYEGAYVIDPKSGVHRSKATFEERVEIGKNKYLYPDFSATTTYEQWADLTDDDVRALKTEYLRVANDSTEKASLPSHLSGLFSEFMQEKTGYPVSGLDYKSLYPSIIMTYNISHDCILRPRTYTPEGLSDFERDADKIRALGHNLHKISFEYGSRTIVAYTVRHTFDKDSLNDPKECNFGIIPTILCKLFNDRAQIKKKLKPIKLKLDELERKLKLDELERNNAHDDAQYKELMFQQSYYDSLQRALKVFMNTFYGSVGNKVCPIYMVEFAGGITSEGRNNLRLAISIIQDCGASVIYGDTDSAYVVCNEQIYRDLDIQYFSGQINKESYWSGLVMRTFGEIKSIQKRVNEQLVRDNGTHFLEMEYEETLFPVKMTKQKKRYAGIPHEDEIVNFKKEPMMRGFNLRKRGITKIMRHVCSGVFNALFDMYELRSAIQIVHDTIKMLYTKKWEISDFIETAQYKPNKSNTRNNTFVRRMKEEYGRIIQPVERFEYVFIQKHGLHYDDTGKSTRLSVGDIMELADIAIERNMQIDIDHYIDKFTAEFATLIADYNIFSPVPDTAVKEATTYIKHICAQYKKPQNNVHRLFKSVYKQASQRVDSRLGKLSTVLLKPNSDEDISNQVNYIMDEVFKQTRAVAIINAEKIYKDMSADDRVKINKYIVANYKQNSRYVITCRTYHTDHINRASNELQKIVHHDCSLRDYIIRLMVAPIHTSVANLDYNVDGYVPEFKEPEMLNVVISAINDIYTHSKCLQELNTLIDIIKLNHSIAHLV